MIDEEITFILFKYTSEDLSAGSHKKVLAVCNKCGKERLILYRAYRDLCISCSCTGNKNPMYGKYHSEKSKQKMSNSTKGDNHPMFGKHLTEETKQKISKHHIGDKNPMWKGGTKMSTARRITKRRKLFGFIPHNKPQKNFHGHHLDFNHVIFIPKEIHTSIWHSVVKNINMDIINDIACDWYLEYQIRCN